MATYSQVKSGLDEISQTIVRARYEASRCISKLTGAASALNAIPTDYSDVITTIDGYGTADEAEAAAKAEKAKLQAEFLALKAEIDAALTDLNDRIF